MSHSCFFSLLLWKISISFSSSVSKERKLKKTKLWVSASPFLFLFLFLLLFLFVYFSLIPFLFFRSLDWNEKWIFKTKTSKKKLNSKRKNHKMTKKKTHMSSKSGSSIFGIITVDFSWNLSGFQVGCPFIISTINFESWFFSVNNLRKSCIRFLFSVFLFFAFSFLFCSFLFCFDMDKGSCELKGRPMR